jgi:hypothetical protein
MRIALPGCRWIGIECAWSEDSLMFQISNVENPCLYQKPINMRWDGKGPHANPLILKP